MLAAVPAPGSRLTESLRTFRRVFENPDLRRIQLAFAGAAVGKYALLIAIPIYAFHAGGVTAVAVVTVVRQGTAALLAPFAASLSDRLRREQVMLASDVGRVLCTGGMALLTWRGAPHLAVYAVAVVSTVFGSVFRPAEAALITQVARTPEELAASNVASSTFDSVGIFAGPALGAALIAASGYTASFGFVALAFLWSALMVSRIRAPGRATVEEAAEPEGGLRALVAGFGVVAAEPRLALLFGLYGAQCFAAGIFGVLDVAAALGLLHMGNAGVGLLEAACGLGAVVGAGVSLALVARQRTGANLGLGLLVWGLPLLAVGAFPRGWLAVCVLTLLGAGNSIVDIAAVTLIQRSAPEHATARVFGVLESTIIVSMAAGTLAAAPLIHGLGVRGTLVVNGALLPVLAFLSVRALAAIDRGAALPTEQLEALRAVPFLAPLPARSLELLAAAMHPVHLPAGQTLFARGDDGDAFYVLSAGSLAIDLPEGTKVEAAPGYVGEIALLREVPRTATVRAETDAELFRIDRDDFLRAVLGHSTARVRADDVVVSRLGAAPA